MDRYRPASGYEKIAGYDAKHQFFNTLPEMFHARSRTPSSPRWLSIPKAESMSLDLQADPGKSVRSRWSGPTARRSARRRSKGSASCSRRAPSPSRRRSFEVHALDPSKPRRVVVMHEGRKLIGTALLKGTEAGPVTIKLQPWGSVAGRIVDDEGRPRKAMFIGSPDGSENKHPETHDILPGSDWNNGVRVGDDGRFLDRGAGPRPEV